MTARALVVMGVAGCGKSAVARELAARLGWRFLEGDEFHPRANIDKMARAIALQDVDRAPWLAAIANAVSRASEGPAVVSCSALKVAYRTLLRGAGDVRFIHLAVSEPTLRFRLSTRTGHFMRPAMLAGQLADLEPLLPDEPGVTLDANLPLDTVIAQATVVAQAWPDASFSSR